MKTKQVWSTLLIRFHPEEYEWLREEAHQTRTPMSELVRRLVRERANLPEPSKE